MKDNTSNLVAEYIRLSAYSIDKAEAEYQLLSSPHYPSLRAITGVLDHFAIEHIAADIPRSADTLAQLPSCFMAHLLGDRFALVIKKGTLLKIVADDGSRKLLDTDEFIALWDGIILVIEKNTSTPSFKVSRIRKLLATAFIIIPAATTLILSTSIFSSVHLGLTLLGLLITFLIVKHETGNGGKLVDAICSGSNEHISCNDVLQSKGAKIFGLFSFGQIGFSYFLTLALGWLLVSLFETSSTPIIQLTLVALPFTLYSVAYQYFAVKKWCLLCLSVVLTLWLMSGLTILNSSQLNIFSIQLKEVAILAFIFMLSYIIVEYWIGNTKVKQEYSESKIRIKRFKQNTSIYQSLTSHKPAVNTRIGRAEIILGNKNSSVEVVIVTSPLCVFCKDIHQMVEQMLHSNAGIRFRIRFNIKDQDPSSKGFQICKRLIEIYQTQGSIPCMLAMNDIYGSMTPDTWIKKYGLANDEQIAATLQEERRWCEHHQISFTPEILINGTVFPKEYDRQDLPMILETISEMEETPTSQIINSNQS